MSMQRKAQSEPFSAAAFPAAGPSAEALGESGEAGMGSSGRLWLSHTSLRSRFRAHLDRSLARPAAGKRVGWAGFVSSLRYISSIKPDKYKARIV